MTPEILKNLHQKTYRLETIVTEQKNPFYLTEKKYVRNAEVYYLGKINDGHQVQVLVVGFEFSEEEGAMGKLLKKISYLFDELELTIDEEGNVVSIDNLLFLRLRWTEIEIELSKIHQGNVIDNYFSQISSLLGNEDQLIGFLTGYNMFGLLFIGLQGSFDTKRKRLSPDGYTEIMTPVKDGEKVTLKISAENLEQTETDYFGGVLKYKGNSYEEGFIEVKIHNYHLKHSLVWIG